jgi:NTP pyrophosphatase (non-canonical NTP hydrolase)
VVNFFGAGTQREMCAEECGELIVALNHHKRGRIGDTEVCVEIADVLIMCHQMSLIFGEREVDAQVKIKLEKIKKLMESRTLTVQPKDGISKCPACKYFENNTRYCYDCIHSSKFMSFDTDF